MTNTSAQKLEDWIGRGRGGSPSRIRAAGLSAQRLERRRAGVVAVIFAVSLSGCSSPEIPPEEKEAINLGANADIGTVEVANLLLVTRAEGEPARLIGVLLNRAEKEVTVTLSDADDKVIVDLDPGQQYAFHEHPTFFTTADGRPGALADVTIAVEAESETARIPIRDGSLQWLEPYLPDRTSG